jgi:gas vesicle protein
MNKTSKVMLGILGAAAAGVVIGMLIAPKKGSDLRKGIKGKASKLGEGVSDLFGKANGKVDEMKEKARRVRTAAEESVDSIKEALS